MMMDFSILVNDQNLKDFVFLLINIFLSIGILKRNYDGRSIVQFDMGIRQDAIGHILLPTNGAIAQPNLFVKDCVLVRQMNEHREFWAPGIVIILPSSGSLRPSWYTVQIYTPSPHQV
jgi:hypothetical protein